MTIIKVGDHIFGGYTDVSWSGGKHIKFFKRGQGNFIRSTIFFKDLSGGGVGGGGREGGVGGVLEEI